MPDQSAFNGETTWNFCPLGHRLPETAAGVQALTPVWAQSNTRGLRYCRLQPVRENDVMRKFYLNVEKVLEDWETADALREIIANAIDEEILSNSATVRRMGM